MSNIRFNPTLKACDWPESVPCHTNRIPIQGLVFQTEAVPAVNNEPNMESSFRHAVPEFELVPTKSSPVNSNNHLSEGFVTSSTIGINHPPKEESSLSTSRNVVSQSRSGNVHFTDLDSVQSRIKARLLPSGVHIGPGVRSRGARSQVLSQSGDILVRHRGIPAKAVFVSGTIKPQ